MTVILVILSLCGALNFKALNSTQISPHLNYILQWETAVYRNLLFFKKKSFFVTFKVPLFLRIHSGLLCVLSKLTRKQRVTVP